MKSMRFRSHHSHSTFSYGDGFGLPETHAERLVDLGCPSMTLTEHGNVSSHVRLEKAATKYGLKPIYGVEAYTTRERTRTKNHLTILAMNQEGYRNLNQLVSRSWAEGFYQYPTVYGNMLADHADGLIVLSGCADSMLNCTLLGGKSDGPKLDNTTRERMEATKLLAKGFATLFGDRYYLEVQQFPGLERTCTLNPLLADIGEALGIPLCATADVHYPYPDDNEMQKILHASHRGSSSVAAQEASWEYDIRLTYPTSDAEIGKNLMGTGLSREQAWRAILATEEIANRCDVSLPRSDFLRYPVSQQDMEPWPNG